MIFGYQTFNMVAKWLITLFHLFHFLFYLNEIFDATALSKKSSDLDHSISDHLNTEQEVCYSDKFDIWMFTIQIPHCTLKQPLFSV